MYKLNLNLNHSDDAFALSVTEMPGLYLSANSIKTNSLKQCHNYSVVTSEGKTMYQH